MEVQDTSSHTPSRPTVEEDVHRCTTSTSVTLFVKMRQEGEGRSSGLLDIPEVGVLVTVVRKDLNKDSRMLASLG